jgi:Flp pilus assembly protein TadG
MTSRNAKRDLPLRIRIPFRYNVRNESGQAGAEAIAIALLLSIALVLLFANVWIVFDTKLRVSEAAREATTAVVEADGGERQSIAETASASALGGVSRLVAKPQVVIERTNGYERCSLITVRVTTKVSSITLPLIGRWSPDFVVRSTHRERIDPFRSGLKGEATCVG